MAALEIPGICESRNPTELSTKEEASKPLLLKWPNFLENKHLKSRDL